MTQNRAPDSRQNSDGTARTRFHDSRVDLRDLFCAIRCYSGHLAELFCAILVYSGHLAELLELLAEDSLDAHLHRHRAGGARAARALEPQVDLRSRSSVVVW